jgi:hypothetical protein
VSDTARGVHVWQARLPCLPPGWAQACANACPTKALCCCHHLSAAATQLPPPLETHNEWINVYAYGNPLVKRKATGCVCLSSWATTRASHTSNIQHTPCPLPSHSKLTSVHLPVPLLRHHPMLLQTSVAPAVPSLDTHIGGGVFHVATFAHNKSDR